MYNFYQSHVWKTINENILKKPTITLALFGETYQGVIWEKKFLRWSLTWIQILGVHGRTNEQLKEVKNILATQTREHSPMFIQLGITTPLATLTYQEAQDISSGHNIALLNTIQAQRATKEHFLEMIGLHKSPKENLPPSTYLVDLSSGLEQARSRLISGHKANIKKASARHIHCYTAVGSTAGQLENDIQGFYEILHKTSSKQGFHILSLASLTTLVQQCYENGIGKLYLAKYQDIENHKEKVVGGAFYIIDKDAHTAIYLYGASDKALGNRGIGHALHWYAFGELIEQEVTTIDLLGGNPIGDSSHPLYNVGVFKEGFGGEKVECIGAYDIVYKPALYTIRKWLKRK